MTRLGLLVVLVAGCGSSTKDVCDAVSGTCVTLHVVGSGVSEVDQLAIDVSGAFTAGPKLTPANPARQLLPIDVSAALPPQVAGSLTVHVVGLLGGQSVGEGTSLPVTVAAGKHTIIPVTLIATGTPDFATPQDGGDGGGDLATGDGGQDLAPDMAQVARVRVANFSPNSGNWDFCYAVAPSTTYGGPILRQLGLTNGVAFPQVTIYAPLPPATYNFYFVPGGAASSCTGSGFSASNIVLAANTSTTLAVDGFAPPTSSPNVLGMLLFVDDDVPAAGGNDLVRFINASPDAPSLEIGVYIPSYTPVLTNATYGGKATGSVDANGYFSTAPVTVSVMGGLRTTGGTTDVLSYNSPPGTAGTISTLFAVGDYGSNVPQPFKVLGCFDNGTPVGGLTPCQLIP